MLPANVQFRAKIKIFLKFGSTTTVNNNTIIRQELIFATKEGYLNSVLLSPTHISEEKKLKTRKCPNKMNSKTVLNWSQKSKQISLLTIINHFVTWGRKKEINNKIPWTKNEVPFENAVLTEVDRFRDTSYYILWCFFSIYNTMQRPNEWIECGNFFFHFIFKGQFRRILYNGLCLNRTLFFFIFLQFLQQDYYNEVIMVLWHLKNKLTTPIPIYTNGTTNCINKRNECTHLVVWSFRYSFVNGLRNTPMERLWKINVHFEVLIELVFRFGSY